MNQTSITEAAVRKAREGFHRHYEWPLTDRMLRDALTAALPELRSAAPVVVICGSTRFRREMAAVNRDLTLAGHVVLAPGVFGHDGDPITDAQKAGLDRLHLAKIYLADEVFVVNPGGYVGESTRREIAYATAAGKTAR